MATQNSEILLGPFITRFRPDNALLIRPQRLVSASLLAEVSKTTSLSVDTIRPYATKIQELYKRADNGLVVVGYGFEHKSFRGKSTPFADVGILFTAQDEKDFESIASYKDGRDKDNALHDCLTTPQSIIDGLRHGPYAVLVEGHGTAPLRSGAHISLTDFPLVESYAVADGVNLGGNVARNLLAELLRKLVHAR